MNREVFCECHASLCHENHDFTTKIVTHSVRIAPQYFLAGSAAMTPLAKALLESRKKEAELARHLGVPRQYVGRWKKGKGAKNGDDFPREHAEKAAAFLGVEPAALLGLGAAVPAKRQRPADPIAAAFEALLPSLSETRRQSLLAELLDGARQEGLLGSPSAVAGSAAQKSR